MTYSGLPQATIGFLAGLEANNTRDWFEAHRADYEAYWLDAGLDLVAALSGPVAQLGLTAVPKLNASLRRIHRDVRFSKDKRPYDPRLHLIFSTGMAFNKEPGVHLVIGPQGIGYGAGVYGLAPEALARYRAAILDPEDRATFLAAVESAAAFGCALDPPELANVPRGMVAGEDWGHLLRRKSVILRTQSDLPLPAWLFTADAVARWAAIVAAHVPLLDWLKRILR